MGLRTAIGRILHWHIRRVKTAFSGMTDHHPSQHDDLLRAAIDTGGANWLSLYFHRRTDRALPG